MAANFIIGLTGGIGSGKSAVADLFAEHGAAVVDTDVIAHALTAPDGAAIAPIRAAFGDDVIAANGALDRAVMRQRVFADPALKAKLEAILHPMIRAESEAQCAELRAKLGTQFGNQLDESSPVPYVVLVVPLLVEAGNYRQLVQRIVVVDCAEDIQVARVMARNGYSANEVKAIMATQATREQRLAAADFVIDNSGDKAALQQQVEKLHRHLVESARFS